MRTQNYNWPIYITENTKTKFSLRLTCNFCAVNTIKNATENLLVAINMAGQEKILVKLGTYLKNNTTHCVIGPSICKNNCHQKYIFIAKIRF
jgi:hypothetical protein